MNARLFLAAVLVTAGAGQLTAQQTPFDMAPATLVAASDVNEVALRQDHVLVDLSAALAAGIEGMPIISADDVEVGRIEGLDATDGTAIVGLGGFFGLGEQQTVLPLSELSFQRHVDGRVSAFVGQPSDRLNELASAASADFS